MSTDMLEDICGGSQSCLIINKREACYNIRDRIKQGQPEWKGALLSTKNMSKGLLMSSDNLVTSAKFLGSGMK